MNEPDGPLLNAPSSACDPKACRAPPPAVSDAGCGSAAMHHWIFLRVGQHVAADHEPPRASAVADVGALVQHPRDRWRLCLGRRLQRQGAVTGSLA
jgi:hypothetical protein